VLETRNLSKSFDTPAGKLVVFKEVSLSVSVGEMLAILGASGTGKSTLLYLLGALDRPTSGTVTFEGVDLFAQSDRALASFRNQHLGFVFQFHHLLSDLTALENVMMPGLIQRKPKKTIEQDAKTCLAEVGLAERFDHLPAQLSGGEQQRVAMARALLLRPKLVLADEPTGNLDRQTGEAVADLMCRLNKTLGVTFVWVTHNEALAARAARRLRMADGTLSAT